MKQIWVFFTHLKLWVAVARHNSKWVKILIMLRFETKTASIDIIFNIILTGTMIMGPSSGAIAQQCVLPRIIQMLTPYSPLPLYALLGAPNTQQTRCLGRASQTMAQHWTRVVCVGGSNICRSVISEQVTWHSHVAVVKSESSIITTQDTSGRLTITTSKCKKIHGIETATAFLHGRILGQWLKRWP